MKVRFAPAAFLSTSLACLVGISDASADTIFEALAKAYSNNSELNSARAGVRVQDENVPLARSGYRPRVTGTSALSHSSTAGAAGSSAASFGIEIDQSIFDGFQTVNNVRAAKARVRAERENLRNTEQIILFDTAQAFVDVLQNRRIAALRRRSLAFLDEQVRAADARFEVGEGTRTDIEQARASRASARAQLTAARAAAQSSQAVLEQLTASRIETVSPASAITNGLPKSLAAAQGIAFSEHPAIRLRQHLVDAGLFDVKSAEGRFLPQVGLSASLNRTYTDSDVSSSPSDSATIGARVTVPIYQGGQASATVRQSKELLGQARINTDVSRDQVRAAVTSAWTQLVASRATVSASQETVRAARLALQGVSEERNVGQRTTLDVLNAESTVLEAEVGLVQAERNVIVASYALLSAMGRLSAVRLGLGVKAYEPEEHYLAVEDKWYGLRTPDGR